MHLCTCACMGAHVRTPQGKGGWGHYSKMPSVLSLLPGGMVPWTRHGPSFATDPPVVGRDSRGRHDPRGTLPWRDSTTRVRGRNYESLTGSRSVLSLVPGAMVPWTRPGPSFATGAPVLGRDSRRQRASRATLPWRDSSTRVRGRNF